MPIPRQVKHGPFGLLSAEMKQQLILTGFAAHYDTARQPAWESYFAHYQRELGRMQSGISCIQTATIGLAAKTHEDIIYIIQYLSEQRQMTKRDLKEKLTSRFPGAGAFEIDRSVDLVVRLWLMLNVRNIDEPVRTPHKVAIHWDNDQSLLDIIHAQFQAPSSVLDSTKNRLHPSFTIATMVQVCGLKLRWTESLEDHLRLDPRKKEIWIFPGKDLLMKHLIASKERQSDILPVVLLRETITTLNLLFPQWDPQTQALLSAHGQDFHTIPPFEGPRRLDLSEFKYWRSHLLELYEEIYLAPADSWRQLWTDRRNPHQWWTFWIAVVVLVLSIVSCITSIIQAWASIEALKSR